MNRPMTLPSRSKVTWPVHSPASKWSGMSTAGAQAHRVGERLPHPLEAADHADRLRVRVGDAPGVDVLEHPRGEILGRRLPAAFDDVGEQVDRPVHRPPRHGPGHGLAGPRIDRPAEPLERGLPGRVENIAYLPPATARRPGRSTASCRAALVAADSSLAAATAPSGELVPEPPVRPPAAARPHRAVRPHHAGDAAALLGAGIHGDALAQLAARADDQTGRAAVIVHRLRRHAERDERIDDNAFAEGGRAGDVDVGEEVHPAPELDLRPDQATVQSQRPLQCARLRPRARSGSIAI